MVKFMAQDFFQFFPDFSSDFALFRPWLKICAQPRTPIYYTPLERSDPVLFYKLGELLRTLQESNGVKITILKLICTVIH
jgi:hypothetical protein